MQVSTPLETKWVYIRPCQLHTPTYMHLDEKLEGKNWDAFLFDDVFPNFVTKLSNDVLHHFECETILRQ